MKQQNYHCSITANITAKEAFQRITRVSEWWSENIEGNFEKLNDVFTIHFVFGDSFVIKIVELVPDKKIVWLVTDCNLTWIKDKKEWKGTKISFEISTDNNSTQVNFTHIGLVPGIECYNGCVGGWNQYIKESLFKLLTEGKGEPDRKK
ncbi:MAG: SRPBCC domain-containing protein [Bacteroidetes bacterium]|nr:SRPBCC domain-containing protein [Bacteroidota bacterium]